MPHKGMTSKEVLALPVVFDVITAGTVFGLARTTTYELVRREEFPCRVLKVGNRYRVTKTAFLEALGITGQGKLVQPPGSEEEAGPDAA